MSTAAGGDLEKLCLKTSGRAAGNLNSGTFAQIEKIKHHRGRDSFLGICKNGKSFPFSLHLNIFHGGKG